MHTAQRRNTNDARPHKLPAVAAPDLQQPVEGHRWVVVGDAEHTLSICNRCREAAAWRHSVRPRVVSLSFCLCRPSAVAFATFCFFLSHLATGTPSIPLAQSSPADASKGRPLPLSCPTLFLTLLSSARPSLAVSSLTYPQHNTLCFPPSLSPPTVDITTVPGPDSAPGRSQWVTTITAAGAVVKSKQDGKNHTLEVRSVV